MAARWDRTANGTSMTILAQRQEIALIEGDEDVTLFGDEDVTSFNDSVRKDDG